MDSNRDTDKPDKIMPNSPVIQADIFSRLINLTLPSPDSKDEKPIQDIIRFFDEACHQIIRNGFKEGEGDRSLFKKMIELEESKDLKLTRELIAKLDKVLGYFDNFEQALDAREHLKQYFLVDIYKTAAEGILDVREDQAILDEVVLTNLEVCKLYALSDKEQLQIFSDPMSRYVSDVYLSTNSTLKEKRDLLTDLYADMLLLLILIKKIQEITDKIPKRAVLNPLDEAILFCAQDAAKSIPDPKKWFYFLWSSVEDCAKQFATAKQNSDLYAPTLSTLLQKNILLDLSFQRFAKDCTKDISKTFKIKPQQSPENK